MAIDLKELGLSQEEIQERVIERICDGLLSSHETDEEGNPYNGKSQFAEQLQKFVKERIDKSVAALAEQHILPKVSEYVENLTLQETTKWGEKVGGKLTFIEYLTQRAEAYMQEEVDYDGKTKAQSGYGWSKSQTRITHLVHKHLHYSIETAMKNAVQTANSAIATGIQETVKIKLEEIAKGLKVSVATK